MKPYVVEFTFRAVVMAEDETDAYFVAEDEFREIAGDSRPDVIVDREVHSKRDLPDGWDMQCIPYGGDGNTRLEALIAPTATEQTKEPSK